MDEQTRRLEEIQERLKTLGLPIVMPDGWLSMNQHLQSPQQQAINNAVLDYLEHCAKQISGETIT